MSNATEHQNGKIKKTKTTSEAESYENDEIEAMEGYEEEFGEGTYPEVKMPVYSFQSAPRFSGSETELSDEEKHKNIADIYEKKKQRLLEKWWNVTGRKPRNIPFPKRLPHEELEHGKIVLFGNRPEEAEKQRPEKWQKSMLEQLSKPPSRNIGQLKKEVLLSAVSDGLMVVRFDPRGTSIASAYRNGLAQVRDPHTGEAFLNLVTLEASEKLAIKTLCYHTTIAERIYLGGTTKIIQVFDTQTGAFLGGSSETPTQINIMDISPNGSVLVAAGRRGIVFLVDPTTLQITSVRQSPNVDTYSSSSMLDSYHRLRVYGLRFHPLNPNAFASSGWDRTLKIWDVRKQEAVHSVKGPFLCGDALDIQDNQILTASWTVEDSLKLYDFGSGRLLKKISIRTAASKYHGEFLYTARFFRNPFDNLMNQKNLVALGGSGFDEMAVVNTETEMVVASFPAYKAVSTVDTYGKLVAYGGKESLFRIGELVHPHSKSPYRKSAS